MRPEFLAVGEGRDARDEITRYLHFRPQFAAMLDERFYTIEWLDKSVAEGTVRALSSDTASILTEIRIYPTGAKELHGLAAVGDLESIKRLIEIAEKRAASEDCIIASIASRPGWSKALRSAGYFIHQVEIRKEL